jgi:DNA (cytosine-5)-methyltransferase 1
MLRAIQEIQPRYIVGENVPGLVNWDGGMVFEQVQADLEAEGYEVTPFILPACGVNAPHKRERIWFIAHNNNGNGEEIGFQTGRKINVDRIDGKRTIADTTSGRTGRLRNESEKERSYCCDELLGVRSGIPNNKCDASDPNGIGLRGQSNRIGESGQFDKKSKEHDWSNFPTQSPVRNGDDEFSSRLDGITFSKWRNESIKAGGNAVVPKLVYQIFKAINEYENLHFTTHNR